MASHGKVFETACIPNISPSKKPKLRVTIYKEGNSACKVFRKHIATYQLPIFLNNLQDECDPLWISREIPRIHYRCWDEYSALTCWLRSSRRLTTRCFTYDRVPQSEDFCNFQAKKLLGTRERARKKWFSNTLSNTNSKNFMIYPIWTKQLQIREKYFLNLLKKILSDNEIKTDQSNIPHKNLLPLPFMNAISNRQIHQLDDPTDPNTPPWIERE